MLSPCRQDGLVSSSAWASSANNSNSGGEAGQVAGRIAGSLGLRATQGVLKIH